MALHFELLLVRLNSTQPDRQTKDLIQKKVASSVYKWADPPPGLLSDTSQETDNVAMKVLLRILSC